MGEKFMEIREIVKMINNIEPDGYYCLDNGIVLPQYREYYKYLLDWKKKGASGLAESKSEFKRKIKKRMARVKHALGKARAVSKLNDSSAIADVGAGYGIEALILQKLCGAKVFAIDYKVHYLSARFKEESEQWLKNVCDLFSWESPTENGISSFFDEKQVVWVNACAESIPLKDNSVDFIFSIFSLEHFTDVFSAVKEIYRVLKKKGCFYCKWENYYSQVGAHLRGIIDIPWGHVFLSKEELIREANKLNKGLTKDQKDDTRALNVHTPKDWEFILRTVPWKVVEWKNLYNEISADEMPYWIKDALPDGLSIEDLLIDDFEAIFKKV